MLTSVYLPQVQNLLQNPSAPTPLYSTATLTTAINTARGQIAGEGQCIRAIAQTLSGQNQQVYPFSGITTFINGAGASIAGIGGIINVRMASVVVPGSGVTWTDSQPWEWFYRYYGAISNTVGIPTMWAQQGQGVNGTIWFYPIPAATGYTINLDAVCYPIPLATDSDPEAIPYPWTDCVQYLAAYIALLGAQSGARQEDADRMFARYTEFSVRARAMSTATVLPADYQQSGRVPPATGAG